jgi:hypothetical protein
MHGDKVKEIRNGAELAIVSSLFAQVLFVSTFVVMTGFFIVVCTVAIIIGGNIQSKQP